MYNTDPVSLKEAKSIAIAYIKSGIIPLFISAPGIGKTSAATEIAKELNADLYHLRLNSIPPEEAVGLQYIDRENKRTTRYAPSWVPEEDGSSGPRLVFLDEITQAPDEYRKGVMSALLERYLGEHKIPDNCYFIAAGNSAEDGTQVYELDRATAERFGVITIKTDFEDWANNYASKKDIHPAIMGYLRMRPDHFEMSDMNSPENMDKVLKPSPRTWVAMSEFLKNSAGLSEKEIKIGLAGKLGIEIANSLWTIVGSLKNQPTLDDLTKMTSREIKNNTPKSMDVLWAYGQAMIWKSTNADEMAKIMRVIDSFDEEIDIPLIETRTNIIETILKRARVFHKFKITDNENIRKYLIAWDHEKRAISMHQNNDNDENQNAEACNLNKAA